MADMIITIPKDQLLDAVRTNLIKHEAAYREASIGYKNTLASKLAAVLADVEIGKDTEAELRRVLLMPKPKNYGNQYARVIRMLEMHMGATLQLTEDQFRNYVEDDWDWTSDFHAGSSPYRS